MTNKKHFNRFASVLMALFVSLALVLTMTACGGDDSSDEQNEDITDIPAAEVVEPEQSDIIEQQPAGEPVQEEPAEENPVQEEPVHEPQPKPVEEEESPAADKYYLKNGDPTKGDDTSVKGIPEVIDVLTSDNGDLLVLVNKYHTVSKDYKPSGMVKMDNKMTTYTDLELKEEAYEAYKKMYADACDQGFNLKVCSAYRTYSTQTTLYVNSLKNRGRETTNLRSAYPGRSEHHTGLALDITSKSMGMTLSQDFADYEDGKWLNENCQEYGFILRYPKGKTDITGYAYEPWHFRYVGVDIAKEIMSRGITLEEYVEEQAES